MARTFFEQHLKRYSKSRRKAPIYWQLATSSASYSVWLYAHRLTLDTFFHVLHDVVAPKLGLEERKLLSLTQEFGPNPTASQRKEIAGQETFVDELRTFRDEVTRVAPLWKPDLDDGVVLTMAPLWRLVPQHRAWQKELKAAWDSLCAGEYDWAHVAMHLWPERVVPKCATDRSLAIAHGLEDVFWEEDAKGKWTARRTPQTPVAILFAERTSPAVKAALKDLLEAPQNRGASKGRRKGESRCLSTWPRASRWPLCSRRNRNEGPAMRVESIRLKNFKAFRDVDMREIPGFCVLIGANGAPEEHAVLRVRVPARRHDHQRDQPLRSSAAVAASGRCGRAAAAARSRSRSRSAPTSAAKPRT